VRITVRDDGEGVSEDQVEEIFIPGSGNGDGGAGLGLALSRRLARTCGGDVTAVARGDGGCFVVDLPAAARSRPGRIQAT
jgi:signal transduction histidine kinase